MRTLTESESETELIAAVKDLEELRFTLENNCVEKSQWAPETDNGTLLSVQARVLLVIELNLEPPKTLTFQSQVLKFGPVNQHLPQLLLQLLQQ